MADILIYRRCVGESPQAFGSRKAYCLVRANFVGPCFLHYELHNRVFVAQFQSYSQALKAATMAIFSEEKDFQQVLISANPGSLLSTSFLTPQAWWDETTSGPSPTAHL